jgi:hypothetical protein
MVCGDANYCIVKKRTYTDSQICSGNNCKEFDINPIDAMGLNERGYSPRKHIKPIGEQMKFEKGGEG